MRDIDKDFIHLARLNLDGKVEDSAALMRKAMRGIIKHRPDLSEEAKTILRKTKNNDLTRSVQNVSEPIPVDMDSRLELVRRELITSLDATPVWSEVVSQELHSVVAERIREKDLIKAGLEPTKSMLLVGPPGVGKTLSAQWLAMKLERPLVVLDLAAVMSSFLGKTGNNIRAVLEFAKQSPSVLLLDEFDAIAKKRNDPSEVGELKRLVTVLLQAVDAWPSSGLLLAATNHPELLDPAVWRRFDRVVEFPIPSSNEQEEYIASIINLTKKEYTEYLPILVDIFDGLSYAEIEKNINSILRATVIEDISIKKCLDSYISTKIKSSNIENRLNFANTLAKHGHSQRKIQTLTGCSRDTLREHGIGVKHTNKKNASGGLNNE